jgi:hypothetical protein
VEVAVGVVVCGAEGIDLHRIRLRGWRTPTLWLAAVLTVLGLGVFPYKALTLGFPVLPGEKSDLWDVGAPVKLSGAAGRSKVSLFMPRSTGGSRSSMRAHLARLRADHNAPRRQSPVSGRCAGRANRPHYRFAVQTLEPGGQRAASRDREHRTASRLAPGRG